MVDGKFPNAYIDWTTNSMLYPYSWITPGKLRLEFALKQEKLSNIVRDRDISKDLPNIRSVKYESGRTIDINVADFKGHPLWKILMETARNNPLFAGNSGYAHNHIIPENPSITPKELASKLSITVGEALAILEGYEPDV